MATTSTSAQFTRSWVLSNARSTPKRALAASADSRRLVDSAVISKSCNSDFNAGICACAAQPRSGLAPMMPTRILLASFTSPPCVQLFLGRRAEPFQQIRQRRACRLRESAHRPLHRVHMSAEHLRNQRLAFRRQMNHPCSSVNSVIGPRHEVPGLEPVDRGGDGADGEIVRSGEQKYGL